MDMRKMTGFALGLFGALLMWQSGIALAHYFHANGTDDFARLLFDPEHSLRMLSAMAAFTAGLAALTERKGGSWLAGFAACLLLVQTLAMLGGYGSVHKWQTEAVFLIIVTVLFLTLVALNGAKERVKPEEVEPKDAEQAPA
ncbi:MAG: hypothetical protein AAGJ85_01020 [Pseudomonadota bacterium]